MAFTNAEKLQHGQSAQESLESILKHCKNAGYLTSISKTYRVGKSGYHNPAQFYAPFLITFEDQTKWALFTTTSMRTDRIKGQQWDAKNLKEINPSISKVYLIYPDACKEENEFIRQNNKYANKEEYSALDAILSQNQIAILIEEYALKDKTVGQIKDIQGNSFESRIAIILSYAENFKKWKTKAVTLEGMHYGMFESIINCFGLIPEDTENIKATCDKKIIGRLPSGGNPKTDVLVEVTNSAGYTAHYTISCKRSSDKSVSVHQYTANTFADVLDPSNEKLRALLNAFQKAGSLSSFGQENCLKLTEHLKPYIRRLSLWALGGVGGGGDPTTQWADYILIYDNKDDSTSMHRLSTYVDILLEKEVSGNFKTPFSWTYPSKRRGESIQLKCKIIK